MKRKSIIGVLMVLTAVLLFLPGNFALAGEPIIIGSPLATSYLYGWDAERAIKLAISEINAAGGGGEVGRLVEGEHIGARVEKRNLKPGVAIRPRRQRGR